RQRQGRGAGAELLLWRRQVPSGGGEPPGTRGGGAAPPAGAGGDVPRRAVLVLEPTEYPGRKRGRRKRGRQMEHIGQVRKKAKGGQRRGRARRRREAAAGKEFPVALAGRQRELVIRVDADFTAHPPDAPACAQL